MSSPFLPYLPIKLIEAAFRNAPGSELSSGKLSSPESSAALAANTFGLFLNRPQDVPPLPNAEDCGWPAIDVGIEVCCRFPWSGGTHPWLDACVETSSHIIGIESKRYEPFRTKGQGKFSKAYWRDVWGDCMQPFERLRDDISSGTAEFERLDAVQLIKHAFGLRTQATRRGKRPVLFYLYAEPQSWQNGNAVAADARAVHRAETAEFAGRVASAEVSFRHCTYRQLLDVFRNSPSSELMQHADEILQRFSPL